MEADFINRGVYYFGEFEERGVLCYINDQVLLGCETAVVGFEGRRNCFLKEGGWLLDITFFPIRTLCSQKKLCLCSLGYHFELG